MTNEIKKINQLLNFDTSELRKRIIISKNNQLDKN